VNFTINWGSAVIWLVLLLSYAIVFRLGRTNKKKTFDKGYLEGHDVGFQHGRNLNTLKKDEFDDKRLFESARTLTRLLRRRMDSSSTLGQQVIISDDLLMYAHEEYKSPKKVLTGRNTLLMDVFQRCFYLGKEIQSQGNTRPPASWGKNDSGSDAGRAVTPNPNGSGDPTLRLPQVTSGDRDLPTPAQIPNGGNSIIAGNPAQASAYPIESDLIYCQVPPPNSIDGGSVVYRRRSPERTDSGNLTVSPARTATSIPGGFGGNSTSIPVPASIPGPNKFGGNPTDSALVPPNEPSSTSSDQKTDYSKPFADPNVQATWKAQQRSRSVPADSSWFTPRVMPGQPPTDPSGENS
jgi:hypothetical protein